MFLAVVLLTAALVVSIALLTAAGSATLARLEGSSRPSALRRAVTTFVTVITLAAAVTAAITPLFS
ncbi:hypothetical protein [Streptomyces atroolivaceus]|uniref:hypothetical protein n=1 Tax=Streptomyces atroolivaceus TaxID=66869 RepID=UPI00343C3BFC